ncbi:MAG TPA: hypothetical protein VGR25_12175 [bacterium]|nr:hypothetical protein [bacterium]
MDRARRATEEARPQKEKDEAREHDAQVRVRKSREDLGQRAKSTGVKFLAKAQEIRDQSGWNIHLSLRIEEQYSDPQFFLRIGQPRRGQRGIRAIPTGDGQWQISMYRTIGSPSSAVYYDDDHLEQSRDALLEPLMIEAAAALGAGDEEAGEQR